MSLDEDRINYDKVIGQNKIGGQKDDHEFNEQS